MLLGVLALVIAAASQAQPLKTIVHVRSSSFCTALRNDVKPAIAGLLLNDELIAGAAPAFDRMGSDSEAGSGPSLTLDNSRMERISGSIEHNLERLRRYLANAGLRERDPDAVELHNIRTQLENVAQQQQTALNVIEGSTDTLSMASAFSQLQGGVKMTAAQPAFASPCLGPTFSALNQAGRFACAFSSTPVGAVDPRTLGKGVGPNEGAYARFHDALILQARRLLASEATAGALVERDAASCDSR